jgi:hypothetical protein
VCGGVGGVVGCRVWWCGSGGSLLALEHSKVCTLSDFGHLQFYSNSPVRLKKSLWESRTTATLVWIQYAKNQFSLSSCFVYFMQPCPLVVKTASAGFSPIGCQPPKWPPSGHSESKYSENTPIHYIRLFKNTGNFFCVYRTAFWLVSLNVSRIS